MKQLQHKNSVIRRCYQQLRNRTGGELRFIGAWSDVYYLPSHVIPDVTAVLNIFRKHEVYVDLAVPTAIHCLVQPEEIEPMQMLILWGPGREIPKLRQFFDSFQSGNNHFMHPTKWGLLAESHPGYAQFFCTKVVPSMHEQ